MSQEKPGQHPPDDNAKQDEDTKPASQNEPPANFFAQLRERNVIRVAVAYMVTAWVLMQVVELVFSALGYPDWIVKLIVVVLIIGAPVAVIVAWIYELTPGGLKVDDRDLSHIPRLSNRQRAIDITVILVLVAVAGFIGVTSIPPLLKGGEETKASTGETAFFEFDLNSIAVLAFSNLSPDPEMEFFGDGLAEEILNVLAKLPEFKVAARTASLQTASE